VGLIRQEVLVVDGSICEISHYTRTNPTPEKQGKSYARTIFFQRLRLETHAGKQGSAEFGRTRA